MKEPLFKVVKCKDQYWLEEYKVAFTGDLSEVMDSDRAQLMCDALNALCKIINEIPVNPKLPLINKIKELAEEGIQNYDLKERVIKR